ncbi:MAG: EAL domain-containing protein [Gammaproteobacteria bacterium]|nr:EAL domain-containing protein [Gammaproteobacteria bacterium]MBT4147108.1 EAL domain-containing protein [Gammaproteobacteria bacterium]MBT5222550.1 EAL domain-containing protein [Gammaproteobacteria bacterium]MBT5825304.1 EAL domain-containing protein [Gammaproteobacteria bacterium]MBT5967257.1 EAL domain-containing protein [Gammaproteobacteria bacterium]
MKSLKMPNISRKSIKELNDAGILVAIDGFGIGQSSLSYLKKLLTNYLKIDRTFIHHMTTSSEDQTLISVLISMAHALNKKIIAVGVGNTGSFGVSTRK